MTFKREEISAHWWDLGKYDGAADGDLENFVRSQGAYLSYVRCGEKQGEGGKSKDTAFTPETQSSKETRQEDNWGSVN